MRSCTRRPTGLSANALTSAVSSPKQRLSPRATLYSPPPSHARNVRVVWMRSSPGSRRSITSPSATRSQRRCPFGGIFIEPESRIPSRSSPHPSTIDDEHVSVHVARGRRGEEYRGAGDVGRRAPASGGNAFENLPAPHRVGAQRGGVVGVHVSRRDRVDVDAAWRPFVRERLGE